MSAHSKVRNRIDLCTRTLRLSEKTWRMIRRYARTGIPLRETTVTEINLLPLQANHSSEVWTAAFNQRREANTGADWEWWLTGPTGRWLGFRVQAKIIDVKSQTYPHLHGNSRSAPTQLDVLCADALRHQAIPIYCLYSCWSPPPATLVWNCRSFAQHTHQLGCSILSASVVAALRAPRKRKAVADVAPFVFPWQCLFCCHGYGGRDLPERAWRLWDYGIRPFPRSPAEQIADGRRYRSEGYLLDSAPPHLRRVLAGKTDKADDARLRYVTVFKELQSAASSEAT
jgi:hypothetical protein